MNMQIKCLIGTAAAACAIADIRFGGLSWLLASWAYGAISMMLEAIAALGPRVLAAIPPGEAWQFNIAACFFAASGYRHSMRLSVRDNGSHRRIKVVDFLEMGVGSTLMIYLPLAGFTGVLNPGPFQMLLLCLGYIFSAAGFLEKLTSASERLICDTAQQA